MSPRPTLPPAALAIARALEESLTSARARDPETFADATGRLATLDVRRTRLVLGGVLRPLLEELHPDGLTGDDLRAAVEDCVREMAGWYPAVDPAVLVVVLAGALGIHPGDDDERPPATPDEVTRHACLLLTALLTRAPRPAAVYLDASFAEIAREETVEQP